MILFQVIRVSVDCDKQVHLWHFRCSALREAWHQGRVSTAKQRPSCTLPGQSPCLPVRLPPEAVAGFWWAAFLHGEKAALCGLGLESLLRLLALLTAAVILCLGQEPGASLLH